ncbi:uncharacterized protein LOC117939352 [Etheostoma cragini]|uniref:uncharacterized protein LOC117939352 n=1 Tax=Etheostoma cragini TaxID=417921 RepID=UPI00155E01A5|nr:uncharacterized protein LOC117939352 [Etheostoma cragini]
MPGLVGNEDQKDFQDVEDLKVLKGNQAHLDQDLKDSQERREIGDFQDVWVRRGLQEPGEPLVLQETVAPVAPKEILDPRDAEVLLGLLVKRVVMVLRGTTALQDPPASQVTRALLEIQVQLVPEEHRGRMGYLDLQERKEPWELLEADPGAQMGREVHLDVLGRRVLPVPAAHLVLLVLGDTQGVTVLLAPPVLLVGLAQMEPALKEEKEKMESPDNGDPKVHRAFGVLLVLQVLVLKERRDPKEPEDAEDHLVPVVTLVLEASRVKKDHQVHVDRKARWGTLVSRDQLV